jgi:Pyridoxamine 5'-phosphate oxidase
MATWNEFESADPELAALVMGRFESTGLLMLGTIRGSGWPRISPCEYLLVAGDLYLGMMWQSKKALDLIRDPRCLVHTVVSNKDGTEGEAKLRGRAADVTDKGLRERSAQHTFDTTGWRPEEPYHLFWLDIEDAAFIQFSGNGDQTIKTWRAGKEQHERVRKWTGSGYED